ncbi:hypothetical protein C2845_PM02G42120 [Panicum miliaceum]|uniref:J domain-containing protein n=1 Tax=Panicum miliaceum TaxID=4540 RepID=A0A3L6SEB4_PANMI|nr:hypothetical protein C2845_PM02G42120 [Panicum miliaceum]
MARYEYEREQAEKACRFAEELFLAGNIPGAHRHASRAKRLCPSLPVVANALAAYEVHAAAGGSWRAVLGIQTGAAATQDAIKKQYRRLSLLVHPDKARCAAAERNMCYKVIELAPHLSFSNLVLVSCTIV